MSYTLFVGENCHQCSEVASYLKEVQIEVEKVNIDQSTQEPPVNVFAFPVLFKGKELIAYGSDIIDYFKKSA